MAGRPIHENDLESLTELLRNLFYTKYHIVTNTPLMLGALFGVAIQAVSSVDCLPVRRPHTDRLCLMGRNTIFS